ncbi:nucleotidyltransferase domain-containing protein [Mesobacillus jeotgali]|uniref:nucleotidyltransferase domain-containing protein n=1 Tax=Mesobacillus jeotgali TaxID=129985 RepID=UPI0009A8B924|nr:hypothetical protein [Mesobacillus jeotgali]
MPFEECRKINSLMSNFKQPWYIAGGWAIDLYLGKITRQHGDIEIALFRDDQFSLKDYLKSWDIRKVEDQELKSWETEFLAQPIHELHASNWKTGDKFEILLNETDGCNWRYRRDNRVEMTLKNVGSFNESGIPYLKPEIVLLYKSKNIRTKDQLDFLGVLDKLTPKQKKWLRVALSLQDSYHPWLEKLI